MLLKLLLLLHLHDSYSPFIETFLSTLLVRLNRFLFFYRFSYRKILHPRPESPAPTHNHRHHHNSLTNHHKHLPTHSLLRNHSHRHNRPRSRHKHPHKYSHLPRTHHNPLRNHSHHHQTRHNPLRNHSHHRQTRHNPLRNHSHRRRTHHNPLTRTLSLHADFRHIPDRNNHLVLHSMAKFYSKDHNEQQHHQENSPSSYHDFRKILLYKCCHLICNRTILFLFFCRWRKKSLVGLLCAVVLV